MATNNQGFGEILQMPPKEHHPKMILLVTVIIICVAFISYYIYYRVDTSDQSITSTTTDQYSRERAITDSLATLKDVPPATQSDIDASLEQLSKSKVKAASQSEIDQSLRQLESQI